MDRWQRERCDEYVRDFRSIVSGDDSFGKYAKSAFVPKKCAAMLLGLNQDSVAFKNLTAGIPTGGAAEGFGKCRMYALRDLARAVVGREAQNVG
jgi:hypothetical protein